MNEIIIDLLSRSTVQLIISFIIYWFAYKTAVKYQKRAYIRGLTKGIKLYNKALHGMALNVEVLQTGDGGTREIRINIPQKADLMKTESVIEVNVCKNK